MSFFLITCGGGGPTEPEILPPVVPILLTLNLIPYSEACGEGNIYITKDMVYDPQDLPLSFSLLSQPTYGKVVPWDPIWQYTGNPSDIFLHPSFQRQVFNGTQLFVYFIMSHLSDRQYGIRREECLEIYAYFRDSEHDYSVSGVFSFQYSVSNGTHSTIGTVIINIYPYTCHHPG